MAEPAREPAQRRDGPGWGTRLDDADQRRILVCMRTTLNLDDALLERAREMTGEMEKTRLVHMGLELLIQRMAAERLAALGGIDARAAAGPRRRSKRATR